MNVMMPIVEVYMLCHMQKCKLLGSGLNNRPFVVSGPGCIPSSAWPLNCAIRVSGMVWLVNFFLSLILSQFEYCIMAVNTAMIQVSYVIC